MSQESLQAQVQDLSSRLQQAEDQIKQLLQLTSFLRNEMTEQKKAIGELTAGKSSEAPVAPQSIVAPLENTNNGIAGNGPTLDESWDFNENMDIDWEALDVLNIDNLPLSTKTETNVAMLGMQHPPIR